MDSNNGLKEIDIKIVRVCIIPFKTGSDIL